MWLQASISIHGFSWKSAEADRLAWLPEVYYLNICMLCRYIRMNVCVCHCVCLGECMYEHMWPHVFHINCCFPIVLLIQLQIIKCSSKPLIKSGIWESGDLVHKLNPFPYCSIYKYYSTLNAIVNYLAEWIYSLHYTYTDSDKTTLQIWNYPTINYRSLFPWLLYYGLYVVLGFQ